MYFYELAILSSPLSTLTYHSDLEIKTGAVVNINLRNKNSKGVIISTCEKPEFDTSEILEVYDSFYSKKQLELAKFISTYYICSLGEALGVMTAYSCGYTTSVVPVMGIKIGEAQSGECQGVAFLKATYSNPILTLSDKQTDALKFLKQYRVSLLFGDTGSGKTEIYMQYFHDMLKEGKRSIFLMPEISLTPQMSHRLDMHFGDRVVMWHSKLTPKQKKEALQKINDGTAQIIAGPRSALFLPIKDLGLIVVDEEHDDSYKSSSRPRYNARDIAIYMGKLYDVPVVLGSATPSLNTYVKFPHVRLKGGHFTSKKEFIYERSVENLSPIIMDSLKHNLIAKEQSIVFLPTRANFKYLICQDCGHTYECVFCSVGMSIHQKSRALKCHYCNFSQAIPQVCSECEGDSLTSSRLGTAEAVKVISQEFKDAKVEQFDRDVITTSNKLKKALKRFNDRETDILVGTQMLSKGHDYHGVTLGVVLGMDNMLNMSDYRAREKALSSLIQVAGRSGRKANAKVLVQTFNEEFFKTYIDNYEEFLNEEKEYRKELYPPYKKLCRILFSHKNGAKAAEAMNEMQESLQKVSNTCPPWSRVEIVGYGKCAVERVANKYRFEILLRADKSTDIIKAISTCRNQLAEIDMDPIEFG
ncbi:primosomal protein N' [Sulfurimonas sp.]|uniref:primosomal protein N' n=1 Tax=Sulfurimonas sp. TaxID=2022749 RepID=UPI0026147312|nr:primosomal protein N' [Sulfurimonas sp.]MCW8894708.1 primosomal protein N' [Sulfurimonas sp.]